MTAGYLRCNEHRCGWIGTPGEILRAPNPFEDGELHACPLCRDIGNLRECCDEPECFTEATCGTPTADGYRRTCFSHMPRKGESEALRDTPAPPAPPVSVVPASAHGAHPNRALEEKIQAAYNAVPEHIREDICEASRWARETLTNLEGAGHSIYVHAHGAWTRCSFAKVEWSGDHLGRGMEHGAQAIVMAVCEYLNGA